MLMVDLESNAIFVFNEYSLTLGLGIRIKLLVVFLESLVKVVFLGFSAAAVLF